METVKVVDANPIPENTAVVERIDRVGSAIANLSAVYDRQANDDQVGERIRSRRTRLQINTKKATKIEKEVQEEEIRLAQTACTGVIIGLLQPGDVGLFSE